MGESKRNRAMIPTKQTLLRPVLEYTKDGEVRVNDLINPLADRFQLTEEERTETVPSGTQTRFATRVHWAKTDLKLAGLLKSTRRAHVAITDRGKATLADAGAEINHKYLQQFEEYCAATSRKRRTDADDHATTMVSDGESTPDEILLEAHKRINEALAADILDRVREAPAVFFEKLIVKLLLAMGYGGTSEDAGQALGQSGDGGVDGVIDQDPLGVDQIYLQAKRYADGNTVGPAAIRDFFGALSLRKAQKGIFVTTSSFSQSAIRTAKDLGSRIVLIDGRHLARLMIRYNIGCRDEDVLHLKKVDEDFFEQ